MLSVCTLLFEFNLFGVFFYSLFYYIAYVIHLLFCSKLFLQYTCTLAIKFHHYMVQLTVPSYLKLSCKNIGVFHSKDYPLYFMGSAGIIKNALLIVILVTWFMYLFLPSWFKYSRKIYKNNSILNK